MDWTRPVRAKRWLFLTHRWLGVLLCGFFAMWFVSGIVMMYVGYPQLTEAERTAHLPPLGDGAGLREPAAALAPAGLALVPLAELRLAVASGGRAVYLVRPEGAPPRSPATVIDAATGEVLRAVDAPRALASAAAWAGPRVAADYEGTLQEDAFTHSRGLDTHRPLHRVRLHDADGTVLYVSGTTGEVVRDAPRTERLWGYVGTWIHWLYPLRGNALQPYWSATVNTLAVAGTLAALAGTVVGLQRWRFRGRYRSGARTPYPTPAMRWHHALGLVFSAATIAWIFSGFMSMNPWKLFDSGAPPLNLAALQGGPLAVGPPQGPHPPAASLAALLAPTGGATRELRWVRATGRTLVLAQPAQGAPEVLDAATAAPTAIDAAALREAIARLVVAPLVRVDTLAHYDLYYYARAPHTMTGAPAKPLPVLRAVFADEHATWVHVDPLTGAVLGRLDGHRRASRWLFAMLHSWDWVPLLERRPLWDAVMLVLGLGGAALSATGMVIGWRRLRRKAGRA
ncbi:PepSY domain-containing protein [Acidovorax sp. SUPP950]|uniref:PepSY domain-containing protein n=1 Tax=Acidovorax sp. SUPP950 TaxID=511901 RepID=UPI0023BD7B07|nr:PepSY domain-containing protein [Acidovorax sp. SUPP950]GKS74832.1 PepSY domain-containing protein [Acidovorax sp. SUPP950]